MPSFVDPDIQKILLRQKNRLGWPIKCWEAVEHVTVRHDPKREHGFPSLMQFKDDPTRQAYWRARWNVFVNCNHKDPDFVAPLFAAMTLFHKTPPREWPLPCKLSYLSTIRERKGDSERSSPLRHPRMKELLEKWFGNEVSLDRIRKELSQERKRRKKISDRWQSHIEHLNQQLDAELTVTPSA